MSAAIGFEGLEKRLEITFRSELEYAKGMGLRALTRAQVESILEAARCSIVSQLSNTELDSYVLSESSLFVYPLKIVIKTCGTTRLLMSIPQILKLADSLSLAPSSVRYTRGTFIFQNSQPAPHRSFAEEVAFLNSFFTTGSAYVLGDPHRKWHVYVAVMVMDDAAAGMNLEMCMSGLDRDKAAVFFKGGGKMTKMSRIDEIVGSHAICDYEFEPCGYSMNGIDGAAYSTVHVTPEDGFSYASYEALGLDLGSVGMEPLVKRVLRCFNPQEFSVAVTCGGGAEEIWLADVEGYACQTAVAQALPAGGWVVYRCYVARERERGCRAPNPCWKEADAPLCGTVLGLELFSVGK